MSCKKFHELISVEVDGLLNNDELSELNEHCKTCLSCRKKRINATRTNSISNNLPINSGKKRKPKVILLLVFITAILCACLLTVIYFQKPSVATDSLKTTKTPTASTEISENKDDVSAPVVKEQTKSEIAENSASSYINKEQTPESVVTKLQETPNIPSDEAVETMPETVTAEQEEAVTPEETEKQTENTTEAPPLPEDVAESISLISSEKSRNEIFDAIHAASPQTETVSADSDFNLELTDEEFSAIVDYLNSLGTEFVISKTPETEMVSASFQFKEDEEDNIQQEDSQTEPEHSLNELPSTEQFPTEQLPTEPSQTEQPPLDLADESLGTTEATVEDETATQDITE